MVQRTNSLQGVNPTKQCAPSSWQYTPNPWHYFITILHNYTTKVNQSGTYINTAVHYATPAVRFYRKHNTGRGWGRFSPKGSQLIIYISVYIYHPWVRCSKVTYVQIINIVMYRDICTFHKHFLRRIKDKPRETRKKKVNSTGYAIVESVEIKSTKSSLTVHNEKTLRS